MKISALLEGRKRLVEGGNLSINGHEAQHLDLKVTKRSYMVPKLNELFLATALELAAIADPANPQRKVGKAVAERLYGLLHPGTE